MQFASLKAWSWWIFDLFDARRICCLQLRFMATQSKIKILSEFFRYRMWWPNNLFNLLTNGPSYASCTLCKVKQLVTVQLMLCISQFRVALTTDRPWIKQESARFSVNIFAQLFQRFVLLQIFLHIKHRNSLRLCLLFDAFNSRPRHRLVIPGLGLRREVLWILIRALLGARVVLIFGFEKLFN